MFSLSNRHILMLDQDPLVSFFEAQETHLASLFDMQGNYSIAISYLFALFNGSDQYKTHNMYSHSYYIGHKTHKSQWHLITKADVIFEIVHITGLLNTVAGCFSCPWVAATPINMIFSVWNVTFTKGTVPKKHVFYPP